MMEKIKFPEKNPSVTYYSHDSNKTEQRSKIKNCKGGASMSVVVCGAPWECWGEIELGHMLVFILIIWENVMLIPIMAALVCTPTSHDQKPLFLYTSISYISWGLLWVGWGGISKQFYDDKGCWTLFKNIFFWELSTHSFNLLIDWQEFFMFNFCSSVKILDSSSPCLMYIQLVNLFSTLWAVCSFCL